MIFFFPSDIINVRRIGKIPASALRGKQSWVRSER